jgi:hypothetical protein
MIIDFSDVIVIRFTPSLQRYFQSRGKIDKQVLAITNQDSLPPPYHLKLSTLMKSHRDEDDGTRGMFP